ncbi:stage II sporulation protein R, partial [Robertmurraya sp.]|uniref:stage II sporulation protein R n=1 Tax=Robertmurraya sp. TaxID=2837525 RepID=UPI003703D60D
NEAIVIPNEAIRLRILANSDLEVDQELKREVRDEVNAAITEWVAELTSVEAARDLIQSRLPEIKAIAEEVLEKNGSNQSVKTDFGKVEFPTKLYGEFLYPAGEYEAVLITLGAGEGANWWCVLFPPLCFLDFSNSVAVKEGVDEQEEKEAKVEEEKAETQEAKEPVFVEEKKDEQEVEVKFFLVELWDKIFS